MPDEIVEEIVAAPAPLLTFADLGLTKKTSGTTVWSASQFVEPERDGQPWCTWEQAEDMLVQAVAPLMRGMNALKPNGYISKRDDAKSTLTLTLV